MKHHIELITKKGTPILIHQNHIKEVFPNNDGPGCTVVIDVENMKAKLKESFMPVKETIAEIKEKLNALNRG